MNKILTIIVVTLFLVVGSVYADVCVTHPVHGEICRGGETYLPLDFPDEIFLDYWGIIYYVDKETLPIPNNNDVYEKRHRCL